MSTQSFFSTSSDSNRILAGFHPCPRRGRAVRRRITPVDGRALEVLGHAIEYLADEYGLSAMRVGSLDSDDPRIEAIQMLMTANREVYYSCPEIEPVMRRFARWISGKRPKQRLNETTEQIG